MILETYAKNKELAHYSNKVNYKSTLFAIRLTKAK